METPESNILIVSLVRYADSCNPHDRHNDCPFAFEQSGSLHCREECRDVIASQLRRGRSAPQSHLNVFDARQLRLSEPPGSPDSLWHTSSLFQVVVAAVRSHPLDSKSEIHLRRFVDLTSALAILGWRGIDPESLVRRGVAREIKLGLAGWLGHRKEANNPGPNWSHLDDWREFFGLSSKKSSLDYMQASLTGPTSHRLDCWIHTAPLDDLLLWRPPSEVNLDVSSSDELSEQWIWLVERFTQTYLNRWSRASLKWEYLRLRGSWMPPFPAELIGEREITHVDVADAIADRSLLSDDAIEPSILNSLTEQAVSLLQEGERKAAASLFKTALALKPSDMDVQNNYAFCLLPDQPKESLDLFRDAASRGVRFIAVTHCNIALAESVIGDSTGSLASCLLAYENASSDTTAYLWVQSESSWIVEYVNVRSWVIELATSMEDAQDAPSLWQQRLESLNGDSSTQSSDPS